MLLSTEIPEIQYFTVQKTPVSIHSTGINMGCEIALHLPCNTGPLGLCLTYTDPFLCMTGYNIIKRTEINLGRVKE